MTVVTFSSICDEGIHPLLGSLAGVIKTTRRMLPGVSLLPIDPVFQEIQGAHEGEDLFICNEMHCCMGMRKLHLEIAVFGRDFQILHCVFFPEPSYDLPIFGTDVVVGPAGISAAIVDLSPVSDQLSLSLEENLKSVIQPSFSQTRELPVWGTIFSPFVKFIRPSSDQEEKDFVELVRHYLNCLKSELLIKNLESRDSPSTIARYHGQLNYCRKQRTNDKTRRLLEKAFGTQWAERYINEVLFDEPLIP